MLFILFLFDLTSFFFSLCRLMSSVDYHWSCSRMCAFVKYFIFTCPPSSHMHFPFSHLSLLLFSSSPFITFFSFLCFARIHSLAPRLEKKEFLPLFPIVEETLRIFSAHSSHFRLNYREITRITVNYPFCFHILQLLCSFSIFILFRLTFLILSGLL